MRRVYSFLFAAVIVTALHPVAGWAVEVQITGHATKLSINDGATAVELVTVKPPKDYPYLQAYSWGGDVDVVPGTIIANIVVIDAEQKLYIPLSAYADLGSPRRMRLDSFSDDEFQLVIVGGDAAGAYEAILDFKDHEITRRRVMSGEFPKDAWEETTYTFNHLDN